MNMAQWLGLFQLVAMTLNASPEFLKVVPEEFHSYWHLAFSVSQAVIGYLQRQYDLEGKKLLKAPNGS